MVVTIAIVGVSLVLSVLLFTALTLLIGQPFYEKISKRVEDSLGGVAGRDRRVVLAVAATHGGRVDAAAAAQR